MGDNTLRELVYGQGAHADTLACVEDLPAQVAIRRTEGSPHSIWQIVEHMNYWMDYELRQVAGEHPRYPDQAIESWPEHPQPAADEQWQATVKRFSGLLSSLSALAESDAGVLDRSVVDAHAPGSTRPSTARRMLMQITAHNSYHAGQIALLRRQSGAWPPQRGGDSW